MIRNDKVTQENEDLININTRMLWAASWEPTTLKEKKMKPLLFDLAVPVSSYLKTSTFLCHYP